MSELKVVSVNAEHSYNVHIGYGILDRVAEQIPATVQKILILHAAVMTEQAESLQKSLGEQFQVSIAEIPDAEAAKRIEVVSFGWQVLGQSDFTRSDLIIALGGGTITDVSGFIAATWLRGISIIQIPSTVLAIVDAAVGGKTGINTAEGKNMVGAFHSPISVVADLELLETLPLNEIKAGFAEIVKCGFILEPEILEILETRLEQSLDPKSSEFLRLVELAVQAKATVVSSDFKEQGNREILNYGHTLGHAIEHAERYQWRHGAAVSIGMMYAAELAHLMGRLPESVVERHRNILKSLDLPTSYSLNRWQSLLSVMQRDKKARAGMLRFIILDDVARPYVLNSPEPALLYAAYQEIGQ